MSFARALEAVLKHEGGYVNDPDDAGGETNYGITKATALAHGYNGPMKTIPMVTVSAIYKKSYWDKNRLDDVAALSPDLAFEIFDAGVNCGTKRAAEWFQKMLNFMNRAGASWANIVVDGDIGPASIGAFKKMPAHDYKVALQIMKCLRGAHYLGYAERKESQEKYIRGWFNRIS